MLMLSYYRYSAPIRFGLSAGCPLLEKAASQHLDYTQRVRSGPQVAVLRSRDWRWFSSLARKRIASNRHEQNSTSDQCVRSRGFSQKHPDPEWTEQDFGKRQQGKLCCGKAARSQRVEDQASPDLEHTHAHGDAPVNGAQNQRVPESKADRQGDDDRE